MLAPLDSTRKTIISQIIVFNELVSTKDFFKIKIVTHVGASKYVPDSEIMNTFHVISYHNCFKGTTGGRKSIAKVGTRPFALFSSRTSEK